MMPTYGELDAQLRDEQRKHAHTIAITGQLRETIELNEREIKRLAQACDRYEAGVTRLRDDNARLMSENAALERRIEIAAEIRDGLCEHNVSLITERNQARGRVNRLKAAIMVIKAALVGVDVDPDAPYVDEYGPISDDDLPY